MRRSNPIVTITTPPSRSNSRSTSTTDDEGSSGTGVHVSIRTTRNDHSNSLDDESWQGVPDSDSEEEIAPSESASRPTSRPPRQRTTSGFRRASESRARSTSRPPPRQHQAHSARAHRQSVPAPPSSVDPLDEPYPGYGRGYTHPAPQPLGGAGGFAPRVQSYAQAPYAGPAGPVISGYAPPFGGAGVGALTHYGAHQAYPYSSSSNAFSQQSSPNPGPGASYFSGHQSAAYSGGHDLMQFPPPQHGYGGFSGYGNSHSGPPQRYYPSWPQQSEPSVFGPPSPDPELEKKLQDMKLEAETMRLESEKAQKLLAEKEQREKEAKDALDALKRAAEERAAWEKSYEEAKRKARIEAEESQRKAAEEKAAWEKKLEEEKRAALVAFEEAQKKARLEAEESARKAAEEKASWERKLEEEKRMALLNYEAAQRAAAAAAEEAAKKAAEEKAAWERKIEEEKKAAATIALETQKAAAAAAEEAAKKAAEEKAAWEKKIEEEKRAAAADALENAKKAAEAQAEIAAAKAAEEQERAAAKAELERIKNEAAKEAAKLKDEAARLKKEGEEAADKLKKENAEALAKAMAPPPEDKKKPIRFKDAVGRKFSFPFHLCATWVGMEELIKQAFLHVEVLGPHVAEGHYDLIGPNGEIILPQVWDTMIEPDWAITMHMWPMPERPAPGPPPGQRFDPGGRPRTPGRGTHHPPGHPLPGQRTGGPPPPPSNWPGGPPNRPGGAPVLVLNPKPRKKEPIKGGVLSWMAGKPSKPSGKVRAKK